MGKNVLLIGSGGREHALAWSLSNSPSLSKLFVTFDCPEFDTIEKIEIINLNLLDQFNEKNFYYNTELFCRENEIDLVVVGPEVPLVNGIVDRLENRYTKVFGPSESAAMLEGSKGFTKDLCKKVGIPTAAYKRFKNSEDAKTHIMNSELPIVIKADGLAAGKGVVVADNLPEALEAVDNCFSGVFGTAGEEVVVEECLEGEEASFFVLSDGENILPLETAQDHKRVGEGDTGPNTGGMGAYCPAPVMTDEMKERTINEIILPTIAEMKANGTPFKGVLYAGLMITEEGPKLIEYNVRFGDPECQVLMMKLKSDLLELLMATVDEKLNEVEVEWHDCSVITVVMATENYPHKNVNGKKIGEIVAAGEDPDVEIFHAGTNRFISGIYANGGRVLNVTARGSDLREAQNRAYGAVNKIKWRRAKFRSDIGWRAL